MDFNFKNQHKSVFVPYIPIHNQVNYELDIITDDMGYTVALLKYARRQLVMCRSRWSRCHDDC